MSKRKQGRRPRLEPVKSRGRRTFLIVLALGLLVAIAAVVMLLRGASGGFDKLNGRWLRPDGGYVLEIRSVDATGKIDAAYLNPNPISVSKAEATRDGSTVKVFVELRAPNYPGSTYTLTYDPQRDQLTGIYFQAVQQQNFDVSFVRMK
jgi:hypothetical protein